eukprot:188189_1
MSATAVHPSCSILYITSILMMTVRHSFAGLLYGVEGRTKELFTVDVITGDFNIITTVDFVKNSISALEYDCTNAKMYISHRSDISSTMLFFGISEINMTDGTEINTVPQHNYVGVYTDFEFVGSTLYGFYTTYDGNDDAWYKTFSRVNPLTGYRTIISGYLPFHTMAGVAYNIETNTMYGVTAESQPSWLATIDLTGSGSVTGTIFVAQIGTNIDAAGISSFGSLEFADNGVL